MGSDGVSAKGQVLVESTLIIDYLEKQVGRRSLMPADPAAFLEAIRLVGIALIANEKVVTIIYETGQRPSELVHQPWIDRIRKQLHGALEPLEDAAKNCDPSKGNWLAGDTLSQADITTAAMWQFTQHIEKAQIKPSDFPALASFSEHAETLPEFLACPLSS